MNDLNFVSEVKWHEYEAEKPIVSGVYLIANSDCNPPFRAACYFDTYHGWSNVGYVLEKLIKYWAEFPVCPSSK